MTVKMLRSITLFSAIITLTACGTVSEWLADDVYEAPPAELTEFVPEFTPTVVWSTDTGDGAGNDYSDLGVWLQGNAVITVDHEGKVTSYEVKTGRQIWQVDLDVSIATGAGGGSGLILIGTQDGLVFALDESNGQLRWQHQLSSEILAPPKASKGVAVARTGDGRMSGLSIEDGSVLWSYQRAVPLLSLRGGSAPTLVDDKVLAGYANGKLVALAIADGTILWEKSVAVPRGRTELDRLVDIDSEPVVKNGVVYVVAYQGSVAALSLDSGKIRWSRDMSSRTGLDVDPGMAVYLSDDDGYVWSLQDGSGDALWRQTRLLRRKVTAPAIVGGEVVVGDFEGYAHWISREDGRFVARLRISDDPIRSKPVVHDDLVFIIATDGTLTALRVR